ncbi:2-hydroxymuconate tautomerase [Dactylosporangium sp. CA-092794]|uniref:2-hydroxymuconate tautomerase n=1 Tax=Dactylosporangium sp. CA-092794 TaxID=3239929 RepID=UPI003D8ED456
MPLVQISLRQGRSPEQLTALVRSVTRAVHEAVEAPLPTIRVIVTEVPAPLWAVGGRTLAERDGA